MVEPGSGPFPGRAMRWTGQPGTPGERMVAIAQYLALMTRTCLALIGAGLVARKARALGLNRKPWVKTSLAPGSQVVSEYLNAAGLQEDLALGPDDAAEEVHAPILLPSSPGRDPCPGCSTHDMRHGSHAVPPGGAHTDTLEPLTPLTGSRPC